MRLARAVRNRRGFTLVELAIVLVIIGIILGAVLKGQDLIAQARAKRIQKDMQGFEAMIWTYFDRTGRLPGDCNSNGIVAYVPPPGAAGVAPTNNVNPIANYCAGAATAESIDTPFSDMRSVDIAPRGTPNAVLARHQMNDYFSIGSVTPPNGITYNVIVVYGIPTWVAKMIDASIDGTINGAAGKIRQYTAAPAGGAWPNDANNNQTTSLVYYYDRSF